MPCSLNNILSTSFMQCKKLHYSLYSRSSHSNLFENAQLFALQVLSAGRDGRDIMQLRKAKHTCTD